MADQLLTSLFIAPTGNTLPTTGSTNNLTAKQFGIFLPDNTPATVGNVAAAKYIYLAQGRNVYAPGEGTLKSDWIEPKNLIKWYQSTGNLQTNTQVVGISDLSAGCEEDISITLRLASMYTNAAYNNGLTRTVMVTTPCCDCGANPCDTLSAAQIQQLAQDLAQAINNDTILNVYLTAGTQGSGATTSIIIQGKTLETYGQGTSPDLTNFPYQFDRVYFWTFLMSGPELTTDYEIQDYCNPTGTVTVLQRASYPKNTPAEVLQLERDFWSYQRVYGEIFSNVNFNGEYSTYVDSALAYDLYYLNFFEPVITGRDIGVTRKDEWVCVAIPKGDASEAGTLAILSAIFGPPDNATATPTSTTAFTTSSTTSSTTTLSPTP